MSWSVYWNFGTVIRRKFTTIVHARQKILLNIYQYSLMMYNLYFKSLICAIIKKILLAWKRSELKKCIYVTDRWTKFLHVTWLFHILTQVQLSKLYLKFIVSSHIHLLFTECIKKCVFKVCIPKCFSRETEPAWWKGFWWCFIHIAGEDPLAISSCIPVTMMWWFLFHLERICNCLGNGHLDMPMGELSWLHLMWPDLFTVSSRSLVWTLDCINEESEESSNIH